VPSICVLSCTSTPSHAIPVRRCLISGFKGAPATAATAQAGQTSAGEGGGAASAPSPPPPQSQQQQLYHLLQQQMMAQAQAGGGDVARDGLRGMVHTLARNALQAAGAPPVCGGGEVPSLRPSSTETKESGAASQQQMLERLGNVEALGARLEAGQRALHAKLDAVLNVLLERLPAAASQATDTLQQL